MKSTPLDKLIGQAIGETNRPLSRAAIDRYQAERLRSLVASCRDRSAFYRRALTAAGIDQLRGLEDLHALPLTTEADLRAHGPEMVCVSLDDVARIVTLHSSGTTGAAKRLYFTAEDLERTLDFFHLGMEQMVDPGQTVAICLPGTTPDSTGHLLARALERMQVNSHLLGLVSDPQAAAHAVAELRPDVLVGFPVQLLALARMAAHLRLNLAPVRSMLLCSDYIPDSVCHGLRQLLGCEVFSHYGTVETGLGGGVDCAAHCGCHLRESDLLVEIIDPRTAAPLAAGQWGEIVITTLTRTGMPLIRYRTGDRGRLLAGSCPCGSVIRRLDRVTGRFNQVRPLRGGGQLALPELDELLLALPGLLDFSASLADDHGGEQLRLCLTTLPGHGEAVRRAAADQLTRYPALREVEVALTLAPGPLIHYAKRVLHEQRKDQAP